MTTTTETLDSLVQQTMEMSTIFQGLDPFNHSSESKASDSNEREKGSGILFYLKQNASSFSVKAKSVLDVKQTLQELQQQNTSANDQDFSDNYSLLDFFPTEYPELAEVVAEQVAGRRFLIHEENICTLNDHGPHWWIKNDSPSGQFKIYFKTPHGEKNVQKLGPIGDSIVGQRRFRQALIQLQQIIPHLQINVDERATSFSLQEFNDPEGQLYFDLLKQIFLSGDEDSNFMNILGKHLSRTLYYYFKELAGTRRFWITIEGKLHRSGEHPLL
ncbi:MAG: hypothetical protein HQK50_00255 [Oligoflexia bacterium]|nr:hypothetical protein [Oligoflexia bacterium]MBF0363966.1 hypothetical protein [Oligoflexia bacterium]